MCVNCQKKLNQGHFCHYIANDMYLGYLRVLHICYWIDTWYFYHTRSNPLFSVKQETKGASIMLLTLLLAFYI